MAKVVSAGTNPVNISARLLNVMRFQEAAVLIALVAVVICFVIASPESFLTGRNIGSFMTAAAQLGTVAIGAALLMISGEFDLSSGSNFVFSGICMGLLSQVIPVPLALLCGLLISTAIGFLNGLITVYAKIPSFITTLGTWLIWFGLALAISGGYFVNIKPDSLTLSILGGALGSQFYASVLWWLALGIGAIVVLKQTAFGNWIFATGGNPDAARAVGVPVRRVKLITFSFIGFTAGLAAIFLLAEQGSMGPLYGQNMALEAIAASVIGGCNLFGGIGTVLGAMLGATMMRMLDSGLVLAGAPTAWYQTFVGVIIIVAVVINMWTARQMRLM